MANEFKIPELGENVSAGDVVRILVKPGDTLAKDQPVLELETDKATIEVPSTVAGKIKDVKVKAGDKVSVGQAILSVEDGTDAPAAAPSSRPAPTKPVAVETPPVPAAVDTPRQHERSEAAPAERVRSAGAAGADKVVDFARGVRPA